MLPPTFAKKLQCAPKGALGRMVIAVRSKQRIHCKVVCGTSKTKKSLKSDDDRVEKLPPSQKSDPDLVFVRACVHVVLKVCRLHGFNQKGFNPCKSIQRWYENAKKCVTPGAFVKYKLAAFYSAAVSTPGSVQDVVPLPKLKNDLDVLIDNPKKLLGGKFARWMDLLQKDVDVGADNLSLNRQIFESCVQTLLLKAKGGMPRLDDAGAIQASIDTYNQLTTPPKLNDDYNELLTTLHKCDRITTPDSLSWVTVEHELRRTVKELFRGHTLQQSDLLKPFIFSKSSNYNNTRSGFGALGEFFFLSDHLTDGLLKHSLITESNLCVGRSRNAIAMPEVDLSGLQYSFAVLYERIYVEALKEQPNAIPLTLKEALKYRTITKGPPFLYTALKPLQKKLWDVVHKNPCFTLIGETISSDFIQSRMGKTLKEYEKLTSVDYKNATNEIDYRCSEIVADEISNVMGLSPQLRELFKRSLVGHIIYSVTKKGKVIESSGKKQANGQLMGSITSFPILCIVNAAICRWSLEIGQRAFNASRVTLRECKLCVNGDDALMVTNPEQKNIWAKISSFVGLKPSIGKVYDSKNFCNMNSMTYHYSEVPWSCEIRQRGAGLPDYEYKSYFRESGCVNMGLLEGNPRSGGGLDESREGTIGSRAHELIRTCPDLWIKGYKGEPSFFLRERVLSLFMSSKKNRSELESKFIPYHIPENMGGVGLPCVGKFQPSIEELKLARKIHENYQLPWEADRVDWKLWQEAMKLHKAPTTLQYMKASEMHYGSQKIVNNGMLDIDQKLISYKDLTAVACIEFLIKATPQQKYRLFNQGRYKNNIFIEQTIALWERQGKIVRNDIRDRIDPKNNPRDELFEPQPVKPKKLVYRLWQKARKDKIPYPEPYGRNPSKLDGYDFPVKHDERSEPIISQRSVDSNAFCISIADPIFIEMGTQLTTSDGTIRHVNITD
jgi:hypothetical protein